MAKSLRAMHWKERLHPRDNRGRFAEKGGSKWLTRVADEMGAAFGDVSMGPRPGEAPRGRLQTGKGGLIDVGALSRAAPRTATPKGTFERGPASATSSNAGVRPPAASLKKGDHARVQGEDIYGRKITMNGYVDNPTQVRVGSKPKQHKDMLSIYVSEQPDGGGTRSRVLVPLDATVERTTPSAEMKRLEGRAPGGRVVERPARTPDAMAAHAALLEAQAAQARSEGRMNDAAEDELRAARFRRTADQMQATGEDPNAGRHGPRIDRKGRAPGATVDRPPAKVETGGVTQTPKQAAALAAGRARAKELRAEDLQASTDPGQNGAKIKALEAGTLDYADLYRKKHAGPSGQRADVKIGRVRHTPDNPSGEFKIVDKDGNTAGWASRTVHDGQAAYVFHSENYDGEQKLEGWSDSLATGADVLINGEYNATRGGNNFGASITQGGFKRYVPLSPEEADRAEAARELKNARERLASGKLGPALTAQYQAIVDRAEGRTHQAPKSELAKRYEVRSGLTEKGDARGIRQKTSELWEIDADGNERLVKTRAGDRYGQSNNLEEAARLNLAEHDRVTAEGGTPLALPGHLEAGHLERALAGREVTAAHQARVDAYAGMSRPKLLARAKAANVSVRRGESDESIISQLAEADRRAAVPLTTGGHTGLDPRVIEQMRKDNKGGVDEVLAGRIAAEEVAGGGLPRAAVRAAIQVAPGSVQEREGQAEVRKLLGLPDLPPKGTPAVEVAPGDLKPGDAITHRGFTFQVTSVTGTGNERTISGFGPFGDDSFQRSEPLRVLRAAPERSAGDDFAAEARAAVAKVDPRKDWNLSKEAPAGAAIPLTSGGKPKVTRADQEEWLRRRNAERAAQVQARADQVKAEGASIEAEIMKAYPNLSAVESDREGYEKLAGIGGQAYYLRFEGRTWRAYDANDRKLGSDKSKFSLIRELDTRAAAPEAPRVGGRRPGGAEDAATALAAATSRDEARAALAGLTVVELRGVAAGMRDGRGITVRDGKDNMINDIVEVAVGRRLDSEAIGRQGGRRPGGVVTGPNARQQAAIELGTSFSGNPYMKLPKLEALTDEDFRGLTPDQQDNVRFLIHKLTQRAPGEDQRRAEALRARFGAWSSGKA
jgi:hypothetical protein